MATFAQMGVTVVREVDVPAMRGHVIGVDDTLESMETVRLTLTLPRPSPVRATFSKEGVGEKLAKLFKRELQTGDVEFDRDVFVSTETETETGALIGRREVRDAILDLVTLCGPISIDGATVSLVVAGAVKGDDRNACRLVEALLA
jgi:hypothetical protein